MTGPDGMVAEIFAVFERHGAEGYGENVSQLDHALQCAQLARDHDCPDTLVVAALLHDIGRMLQPAGNDGERHGLDARHEDVGAAALAGYFPPAVTEPIRLHVAAKRYLCAVDAEYRATLSDASLLSLKVQGGAMTDQEVAQFRADPFFAEAIELRRFDDWGKRTGCPVAALESYRPLIAAMIAKENTATTEVVT